MTFLHDDPSAFAEDALAGLCDAYSHLLREVPGGAVRRRQGSKVAVLYCGGSGHYPAFAGVVGPGMGDGAVCGNIFTSPSADHAVSVATAAHSGQGVIFSYGNYAGDVMNFGMATERLRGQGMQVENVIVTDDVASAPIEDKHKRRGIAGDFTVFKVMGAAAERGDGFDDVVRLGRKANEATRTMGVAFAGCTLPGAEAPLFEVPEGHMGLGLGIHGEPGLADVPLTSAKDLAKILVDRVLAERPGPGPQRAAVILNGLGATKYEELFVLWRSVARLLREADIEIVTPEVGELVTSLDMAGTSLTLMFLDAELEDLWNAPALTPAFTRGAITAELPASDEADPEPAQAPATAFQAGSAQSQQAATATLRAITLTQTLLHDAEPELGRLDAIAGDGDHGRGMVRGVDAAAQAATEAAEHGVGAQDLLAAAGDAWAGNAGGTSGVLWGAGLRAAGEELGNDRDVTPADIANAAQAFVDRLGALGKASVGDKTMLDAAVPFATALMTAVGSGSTLSNALAEAAAIATESARQSADLRPQVGRARPLAEKSIGTPDPGATSFALIVAALAKEVR